MIKATRRISSATHAPCVHDVMTGISRIAPDVTPIPRTHCNAADFRVWQSYELLQNAIRTQSCGGSSLLLGHCGLDFAMRQARRNFIAKVQAAHVLQ